MSNIQLCMRPKDAPMSWTKFVQRTPGYSIAIDGYVGEAPNEVQLFADGPRQNFNHHEGIERLAARATCEQVLLSIRLGFFQTFRDTDGRRVIIHAHDCDEDVDTTVFLFRNSHLVEGALNPALNRYVAVSGLMDATGGSYPFPPDLPFLEEHAWTVEPYLLFRASGGLRRRDADEFTAVVDDVGRRIMDHIMGRGKRITLKTDYDVIHRGTGWCLVHERGTRARLAMFNDGIRAFVSVKECPDGRHDVIVGRFSPYVPFPVLRILENFNLAEGLGPNDDRAGGSNLIGGTSRNNGTKHSVTELIRLTEETVLASRQVLTPPSIIVP